MTKGERGRLRVLIHQAQGGLCCYCRCLTRLSVPPHQGLPRPDDFATIEHLHRIADGGTDAPDNLALSCFACNSARGAMSWVEFKTLKAPALKAA